MEFESDLIVDGTTDSLRGEAILTPDQLYDLQCAQEDMRREEMLSAWGVETWEELEFLGHDW